MHRSVRNIVSAVLAAAVIISSFPVNAYAATEPIKSVSIRVESKLQAGSGLPDIAVETGSVGDGEIAVKSGKSGDYTAVAAEWVDKSTKIAKAGDEPRMKVTLEPVDVGERYFQASYKASNVKITGGTFVSASRNGDDLVVVFRIKGIKGAYDPPKDAYWNEKNLGEARWVAPENTSGTYEVQLFRGSKSIYKIPATTAKTYNFYPYMTEKGDYTFKVRTVQGTDTQKKYGDKSTWIESGELQITDRYVSDGKGQQGKNSSVVQGATEPVGWSKENNVWYYRYPDGRLSSNGWEFINGYWYYFGQDGAMQTGWQNLNGRYYYFHPSGEMAVGWNSIDGKWYYFRPEAEGSDKPEGSMADPGWRVIGAYYYFFNDDGSLYTGWLHWQNKWYYLNAVDNSLLGAMFTGWIKRDNKTYFADYNGQIMEGWCQIDGDWYYFYPGSGEMAQNTVIDGFPIGQDGIWRQ